MAFTYLAEGKRDRDIALCMGVAQGTIRHLFFDATKKLDAETRCHALALLVRQGKL